MVRVHLQSYNSHKLKIFSISIFKNEDDFHFTLFFFVEEFVEQPFSSLKCIIYNTIVQRYETIIFFLLKMVFSAVPFTLEQIFFFYLAK